MYPDQPPQNPYPPQGPTPPQGPAPTPGGQWQQPGQPQPQQNPQPQYQPQPQQPAQGQYWQQQPQPQTALPSDYLNQIAPQTPKRAPFTFGIKQIAFIGGALIILVLILVGIVNAATSGKGSDLEHLTVRLTNTATVVTNAQPNLKSSQLRSLNASLNLYFTNTNRDIAVPLKNNNVNIKSISKSITTAESTTALAARLENARLNAVFDSTYSREMAYQLGNTLTLMAQIYKSTSSQSLKTFLNTAYNNLKPLQQGFADFTTTD